MYKRGLIERFSIITAIAAIIIFMLPVGSRSNTSTAPKDIDGFFRALVGDWVGSVEQYTGGVRAANKYFHAVTKQTSSDTYQSTFTYYRIDKKTHAGVMIGTTTMTTKISPDGSATNTMVGKGEVFINPRTLKQETHELYEVLRMSAPGAMEGKGGGKVSVLGLAMDAGKSGKVSHQTSTWKLNNDTLNITQRLKASFHVLFFNMKYEIEDRLEAKPGDDVLGLMKDAVNNTEPEESTIFYP
jgi:hypothetical protein